MSTEKSNKMSAHSLVVEKRKTRLWCVSGLDEHELMLEHAVDHALHANILRMSEYM